MYAIIKTGGKQYRVTEGETIEVERLTGAVGQEVEFHDVLFVGEGESSRVGGPAVEGARVVGTILAQKRGAKVLVFKFKKRKMYRKLRGHRQELTAVKVSAIEPLKGASKEAGEEHKASKRASKEAVAEPKASKGAAKGAGEEHKASKGASKEADAEPKAKKSRSHKKEKGAEEE